MTENIKDEMPYGPDLPPMFWAAAGACALPILIGLIGFSFSLELSRGRWHPIGSLLTGLPIWLCFIFGTPLVAWLSCRDLVFKSYDQDPGLFKVSEVWNSALKYSFYVHSLGFLSYAILLSQTAGGAWASLLAYSLIMGGLLNAVLFVVVTLPLSLLCTAIFARLYPAPAPVETELTEGT